MHKSLTDMPRRFCVDSGQWSGVVEGHMHLCLCECVKESSIYSTDSRSSTVTVVQSVDQM